MGAWFVHWDNFDKLYGIVKHKIEKKIFKIKYVLFWVFCKHMVSAYVTVDYAFDLCDVILMYFSKCICAGLKYIWKYKQNFLSFNEGYTELKNWSLKHLIIFVSNYIACDMPQYC